MIPRMNPATHKKTLSKSTNHNNCSLEAPVMRKRANSYLRSFKVLYNTTKLLIPEIKTRTNPATHKQTHSKITNTNNCSLEPPVMRKRAKSYLRSFKVLYNATKILIPEINMIPNARYFKAVIPTPNKANKRLTSKA